MSPVDNEGREIGELRIGDTVSWSTWLRLDTNVKPILVARAGKIVVLTPSGVGVVYKDQGVEVREMLPRFRVSRVTSTAD